jgi:hypothetical protein
MGEVMKYSIFLMSLLGFVSVFGMEEGPLVVNQCTQEIAVRCSHFRSNEKVEEIITIGAQGQKYIFPSTQFIAIQIGDRWSNALELDQSNSMLVIKLKKGVENKIIVKEDTSYHKLALK